MSILQHAAQAASDMVFNAHAFAVEDRLAAFDRYVRGSPGTAMNGALFQPISDDNPNYIAAERLVADNLWLSIMETSGYQSSLDEMQRNAKRFTTVITVCQLRGGTAELRTPEQSFKLSDGDIYVNATNKFHATFGEGKLARVIFPAEYFKTLLTKPDDIAILRQGNPINDIVRSTITALDSSLRDKTSPYNPQLSSIARELTYNILADNSASVLRGRYQVIRERARSFILRHLDEPELDVATVANAVNASRATLYRAFENDGGIRDFINRMRLDAARKILEAEPPQRGLILNVALSCGLNSSNQLSRAFKGRFGMTPSEFNLLHAKIRGSSLQENN